MQYFQFGKSEVTYAAQVTTYTSLKRSVNLKRLNLFFQKLKIIVFFFVNRTQAPHEAGSYNAISAQKTQIAQLKATNNGQYQKDLKMDF